MSDRYENWGYRWGGLMVLALAAAGAGHALWLGGWLGPALAAVLMLLGLPLISPRRVWLEDGRLVVESLFARRELPLDRVRWVRVGPGLLELELDGGASCHVAVCDAESLARELAARLNPAACWTGLPAGAEPGRSTR